MYKKQEGAIPLAAIENEVLGSVPHSAVADAGHSGEGTVTRISPCVDIEYPFTEEGKPSCLSRACPKDKECKVCCKDWRKP